MSNNLLTTLPLLPALTFIARGCSMSDDGAAGSTGGGFVDSGATAGGEGGVALNPGVVTAFEESTLSHNLMLGRARSLALVNETCATGSSWLPYDIDLAIFSYSTI